MSLRAQRMSSTRNPKQDLRPSQCGTNRKRRHTHSQSHIRRYSSHARSNTQSATVIGYSGHTRLTVIILTQRPIAHHTRRRVNSHGAHAHNVEVMITIHASPHMREDNHTRSHEMITAHVTLSPPHTLTPSSSQNA